LDRFQRIAQSADCLQPPLNIEKALLPHDPLAPSAHDRVRPPSQIRGDLARGIFRGAQLLIYHFMYGTDWNEGCKNCSFWADSFHGITAHLKHRDVTMIVVSRAPYAKLNAFQKRMGWRFKWVSSGTSDFNHDFNVSFTPEEMKGTVF